MSTNTKNKTLKQTRANVVSPAKKTEAWMIEDLVALSARYGFRSVAAFFTAVTKAVGKRGLREPIKTRARSTVGGKGMDRHGAIPRYKTPAERSRLTIAGMKAARRRGTRFGRPPLDPKIVRRIHAAAARMGHQVRAIARKIQVPPSTVCRVLARGR